MKATPGARRDRKRVGRGDKTATRGENGQKSRSGYSRKIGFEGGQNPLYRRIPKYGFTNIHQKHYTVVNLDRLERVEGDVVSPQSLIEAGVLKNSYGLLKILGQGEVVAGKTVQAHKFSKTAVVAIEAAGGTVEVIK